jgi:GntR family transcriptional regulator
MSETRGAKIVLEPPRDREFLSRHSPARNGGSGTERDGDAHPICAAAPEQCKTIVLDRPPSSGRKDLVQAGRRLPEERNLAVSLGVSRDTIRVALERLEGEEVVSRSAQRGWFVPRQTIGEPPSTLQSFTEMARLRGLTASAVVLEKRVRSATFEEAAKLTIVPGAEVLYIARLRGMSGTPICVDSNVIPLVTSRALLDVDLTDQSLYDVLERLCGLRIHRSAYSVQADAAPNDLAPFRGGPIPT